MRILGLTVSRTRKGCPNTAVIDALAPSFEQVCEIIDAHTQDLATLNTAMNRVERKQNRWLDVLNLKGEPPEDGDKPPVPVLDVGMPVSQEAGSTEIE